MPIRISKPPVNIREKLAELERPIGVNGAALMATSTPQDAFSLIGAGRRNLLINGDMIINQRGIVGGSNNVGTSRAAGYGLDRWTVWRVNDGANAAVIQEQSTDVPTGQYFKNSLKLTVNGTGNPTANTNVRFLLHQMIEGNNMYQLRYGTSGAGYFTFSFWVKCSVTGIYAVTFTNNNGDRGYVATYNINSASTWEYKTITVPGDTTGTWTNDNTAGLTINFDLGVNGPTTSTYNTWLSGDYRGGTTTTKLNANNGATYFITGIQLEEGKVATPFEQRSVGEELALCQRYFQIIMNGQYRDAWISTVRSSGGTTTLSTPIKFSGAMRASPNIPAPTVTNLRVNGRYGDTALTGGTTAIADINERGFVLFVLNPTASGWTFNLGESLYINAETTTSNILTANAEL